MATEPEDAELFRAVGELIIGVAFMTSALIDALAEQGIDKPRLSAFLSERADTEGPFLSKAQMMALRHLVSALRDAKPPAVQ